MLGEEWNERRETIFEHQVQGSPTDIDGCKQWQILTSDFSLSLCNTGRFAYRFLGVSVLSLVGRAANFQGVRCGALEVSRPCAESSDMPKLANTYEILGQRWKDKVNAVEILEHVHSDIEGPSCEFCHAALGSYGTSPCLTGYVTGSSSFLFDGREH